MGCYVALEEWTHCVELAQDMEMDGIGFDEEMYRMLIGVLQKMGDIESIHLMLAEMKKNKLVLEENMRKELLATFEEIEESEMLWQEDMEEEEEVEEGTR